MKTRSQNYAERAWGCVGRLHQDANALTPSLVAKDYRSHAMSLPVMILQCGLAQTLAFVQNKAGKDEVDEEKENAYKKWIKHMAVVLDRTNADADLAREARTGKVLDYLLLTRQALEAASWLKRYAEAIIPAPQAGDNHAP